MKAFSLLLFVFGLLIGSVSHSADTESFDGSAEVKPLTKELSNAEENADADLDNIDYGQELPELLCSDEKLKKQVANFIYSYINHDGASSVIEKRAQYLLVRNLNDFVPESDKNLNSKDNYSAASAVAYLKINQNKEVYKICRSFGNDSKKFADLFAVIYRDGAYYQVVVPNVMVSTNDIDKATFTYNW